MSDDVFLGVDVGTGSVRAALVTSSGTIIATSTHEIKTWNPSPDFYQQSSEDIWQACAKCIHQVITSTGTSTDRIKGIGFDATCSLVVLDENDQPVTVSPTGENQQNIILWMDHRAMDEVKKINGTHHKVLDYVGGIVSPEMETPKVLWMKQNLPSSWVRAKKFFDLADYLTYRATGHDVRSLCTVVCKWTFQGHLHSKQAGSGWDESFFREIGLEDLVEEKFERIGGDRIHNMGEPIGTGLTETSAKELGLLPQTPVAVGIIDAHAGGLGLLGAPLEGEEVTPEVLEHRLALISGTSSCHMAVSNSPLFISGIWGPYYSAMIPGMWLTEGGQSATGALLDNVLNSHSSIAELKALAATSNRNVYEVLNERLAELSTKVKFSALLTKDIHVLPYFHGNRSPRADPSLKGMISGLTLHTGINELALIYLATIQAIAYGTRHIIAEMNLKGHHIDTIFMTGGLAKNPLYTREHADVTGCNVVLPKETEAVLLGASILGAVASKRFNSIVGAMSAMSQVGKVLLAATGEAASYHTAKYAVFLKMYEDQVAYKNIMSQWSS